MHAGRVLICLIVTGLAGNGCSFLIPSTPQSTTSGKFCAPVNAVSFDSPYEEESDRMERDAYSNLPLSSRTIETARVMNVLPILAKVTELQQTGQTRSVEYLQFRQALSDRLMLTMFELSSSVAEIVCERDRADQVADRMEEIDAAVVRRLTLASIVIGGVASVVSGGIGLAGGASTGSNAADVAGGVVASVFGGTALFTSSKQEFRHERNLLKEVWDDPQRSAVFSPAIWRFLQSQQKDRSEKARDKVIQAWRQQGRLGEPGSAGEQERIALLFSPGGTYTATDLRARASMLETLEAHIQLLSEELELFLREVIQKGLPRTSKEGQLS